jgi:membrane-bound metal-dependent hydrolase YbcI (DUF457 family)
MAVQHCVVRLVHGRPSMPLPLAHSIVGYSVAAASGVRFRKDTLTALLFSIVVANLPDLDFLPGALANEPVAYHRNVAHTIPAALLCGLIIGAVLTRFGKRFWEIALLGALVYGSHLFADMVNFGGGNIGVQMFWPFSDDFYYIPTPLMHMDTHMLIFHRGHDSRGFFASFFSFQFLRALVLQALLFAPLLLPAWWIRWKRSAA